MKWNNNGISHWDLLDEEMKHLKGFNPDRHNGIVRKHSSLTSSENKSNLVFFVDLPFPIYAEINGIWKVDHIIPYLQR